MKQPLRVLFVDDHNASRSRMAEAIMRAQGAGDFEVAGAGAEPQPIDPQTRDLLQHFDMSTASDDGTPLERYADETFDFVIVLRDEQGGESEIQTAVAGEKLSWDVPDPAKVDEDGEARERTYRRIFELLRQRIQVFILAQHDMLRERGSDNVVGAHQPTEVPLASDAAPEITLGDSDTSDTA